MRALVPHLCYEIKMFLMTATSLHHETRLAIDTEDLEAWTAHNAMLESLTIHARILSDFFFAGRGKDGDVIAGDYVADWQRLRGKKPKVLLLVNPRVGHEIAHLNLARLKHTPDTKAWPSWEIVETLFDVLKRWLEHSPPDVRNAVRAQVDHVNTWIANRLAAQTPPPDADADPRPED